MDARRVGADRWHYFTNAEASNPNTGSRETFGQVVVDRREARAVAAERSALP